MRRKWLAQRAALCYTVGEIRAAHRAVRDIAAYRTYCRTKKEGRHIRAAKRQIEPRGARHPEARISKPHPRKGTETYPTSLPSPQVPAISKPHPRKGTETSASTRRAANFRVAISKPHPRKGTERANPSLPCHSGGGGPRSGGRGALNDLRISIVRKSHPLQAPPPARTARHLPRFDGGGE